MICSSITSYFPVSVLSVYFQLSVIFIYLFHILNYYLGIKQFHNFVRYFVVSAAAERRCHDPRILLLLHTGCCMLHCTAVYSSLYYTRYIYSALYCTKYIYSALYCTALLHCSNNVLKTKDTRSLLWFYYYNILFTYTFTARRIVAFMPSNILRNLRRSYAKFVFVKESI